MTIDEAIAKATEAYDVIMADAVANAVAVLRETGDPTPAEIADFLQWYQQLLANDRVEHLNNLRAFLERGGEPLQ